jgi:hypothetical protein
VDSRLAGPTLVEVDVVRKFDPDYSHEAVARHLRREAMKGFQRGDDPVSVAYVLACRCGVNLMPPPNSVSLILTRDSNPDCVIGWHLSVCCVTDRGYRGYVEEEGQHWLGLTFGHYAHRAVPQPLNDRTPAGIEKDVRHFVIECNWSEFDPIIWLGGL